MAVQLVYEPVLLARRPDKAIFLEVNSDISSWQEDPGGAAAALAERATLRTVLVPDAVERVVSRKKASPGESMPKGWSVQVPSFPRSTEAFTEKFVGAARDSLRMGAFAAIRVGAR